MNYTVLSPWAKVNVSEAIGLSSRLTDLNGKTIGMFYNFKGHCLNILKEVEKELLKRFPNAKFTYLQYTKDTIEITDDPDFYPVFKEWVNSVDGVIAGYGDAGSCAMFLAYNTCIIEKLGKPAVMMVKGDLIMSAQRGASARFMPNLRFVKSELIDMSALPAIDQYVIDNLIRPAVLPVIDELVDGLIKPLTKEELTLPTSSGNNYSDITFTGSLEEINNYFYKMGWTNGMPIVPPTREAVNNMLRGTDLDPDFIIAKLPPMLGDATVEKIAVNAVMAGCLPIYMPVLIALVEAMVDPCIHLEGWTCSVAGFAPVMIINGPIRNQIKVNGSGNLLSPYYKANATIARAFSFIIMNIAGVRPTLEDNAYVGHEARYGTCFAEDEENCPWEPMQTVFGFNPEDSTVTLLWSHGREYLRGFEDPAKLLSAMCKPDPFGFNPGCTFIIPPKWAKVLSDAGFSRNDVRLYISEYSRKSSAEVPLRWLKENNHVPKFIPLPLDDTYSCRRYWSTEHIQVVVGGAKNCFSGVALTGGGDHGGPACVKIKLPENWDKLLEEYNNIASNPNFIEY